MQGGVLSTTSLLCKRSIEKSSKFAVGILVDILAATGNLALGQYFLIRACPCVQGVTDGVKTIIKTYRGGDEEAEEAYKAELEAYKSLHALQGSHIPRLLFFGLLQDTCDPTLVLEHCGASLESMPSLTPSELRKHKEAALIPLRAMHSAGALHGDLHFGYDNIVMDTHKNRVVLINLRNVRFPKEDKLAALESEERELSYHDDDDDDDDMAWS